MAGGGSINLRMSLQGAEQVKAELASIGPAGSKMARDLDRAMRQPAPGMKALDAATGQVRQGVEGLAGRTGPLGAGLSSLGGIGLAAAAGLGVLAIGLTKAREAMQWADELSGTADRIGTSAEALQGLRFAAEEVDVSAQSLDANLEKLNATLGAFKSGVGDAKLKPVFEALGITQDQLATVDTADQMLLILADTLGQVQDRAVQVKFAKSLGVEESLPLLRLGADGIRELTAEAERLGLVAGKDVVEALAEADRQMEIAQQRIDSSMRLAVVGLADDFADVVSAIASIIGWLARLDAALEKFSGGGGDRPNARGIPGMISDTVRGRTGEQGDEARDAAIRRQPGWMTWLGVNQQRREYLDRRDRERAELAGGLRDIADGTGEFAPKAPGWERPTRAARGGGGGRSSADRDAERQRRDAEREAERVRVDELRAADDILRRDVRGGATAAIRANAARLLAESEAAQEAWNDHLRQKTLQDGGMWDEETALRFENLQGLRQLTRDADERERVKEEQERLDKERTAAEQAYIDVTADILSLASSGARTAEERRGIELRLLEIAQQRQRAELENLIAATEAGEAQQRYIDALNLLPDLHAAQRDEVSRQNSGPLGQWRESQFQTFGEVGEHIQGVALDALDGLNAGLRDAWKNAESAGDAFEAMGDVAVDALGRVVDALMEVAIQKLLIEPLVNGIFGGPGQSGGGLLGSFLSNLGGSFGGGGLSPKPGGGGVTVTGSKGFARGGLVGATGLYPVGEEGLELAELPGGTRIHNAHRTAALMAGMEGGSRGHSAAPVVNVPVNVINQTSQPVKAEQRRTPDGGVEVILRQAIRGEVGKMGADGTLARAHAMTPQPIKR
ncbi:hypothetical protein [Brevundimonas sp.]|uniref:hypothetical protein n=1 Tax=Brevundimonas sp. TaxID=1871086 RepID=UPI002FC5C0FC